MPFFQYTATDKTGKRVEGTLQASTSDAARLALQNAGMNTLDVRPQGAAAAAAPVATPRVIPTQARPAAQPQIPKQAPVQPIVRAPAQASMAASAVADVVKTKPGNDKQLFFILTQLGDFYRSGIAPNQALHHLAAKAPPLYKESLEYASARVGEGKSLADCLSRYPNLYPAHIIGAIRAGETSGFVPDAIARMSNTVHSARRIGIRSLVFLFMAAIMVIITPLSLGVINGALDSIKQQDAAGGTLPVGNTISAAIVQQMKLMAPMALGIALACWILLWVWRQPFNRRLRHTLGLLPPLRRRAQTEAMHWLGWSMGMAARAGLNYQAAYSLAVQSIPNLVLREKAIEEARSMRENEPLSQALSRSTLLPPEYGDMVHNGEIAGTVPNTLSKIGEAAEADFQRSDALAEKLLMVLLYIPLGILTLVLAAYLITTWYKGLIDWGLSETMGLFQLKI